MTRDEIGDVLREFYGTYGRPDEGPPPSFNVSQFFQDAAVDRCELNVLQEALDDGEVRRQFVACQKILEDLATRLTSGELLRDLSGTSLSSRDFEELSNGILWFSLAASLDKRDGAIPVTPFDTQVDLPLPVKIQLAVQGSLVLRLYIALVYMREGVLSRIISQGALAGSPCCAQIRKLLNSDYVRRIRNALSHGTFSSCIAGLVFRGDDGALVATPGFLSWLSTWLMHIQLQATAANKRGKDVP
jgi:hypothetical protein